MEHHLAKVGAAGSNPVSRSFLFMAEVLEIRDVLLFILRVNVGGAERMDFMCRKGNINDCEAVYHLICEMEGKELPYRRFSEIYQEQIGSEHYYCLVCEQENKVIGMLNLRFEEHLHHSEWIAEIMEFAVDSSYRSKGIGKEMFSNACQLAKDRGCTQVEVACNQLRTNTHRFYLREGMHNFHFKFSKTLVGADTPVNAIGK